MGLIRFVRRWVVRLGLLGLVCLCLAVVTYLVMNPSATPYMRAEEARLGDLRHIWVDLEDVSPVTPRIVVAAEDANFCRHWGFDRAAILAAFQDGGRRGGSTITQQVVKNVYLWQGRSYTRKALEALMTPVVELFWSKRRIIEVYLNIAEFDEGVFGIEAAALHHFGVSARNLSAQQAARLAVKLPNPKVRSATNPSSYLQRRARSVLDGAATLRRDRRNLCFQD